MGIPSYYKKLADKIKGLITRSRPAEASALLFDFNCLIYHCARRPNSALPPYPGEQGRDSWEKMLVDDIAKYVQTIWHEAGEPKEVFLSIDGVVPMAKIKQQRLRRFKSIWLQSQEPPEKPVWDTNCITPGTEFMKLLSSRLNTLCSKHKGWVLSDDCESGEGEHKIMNLLRKNTNRKGPLFVYGLDADLILLTMLNSPCEMYLIREASEMGVVQTDVFGAETFSYFSLEALKSALWKETAPTKVDILEYVTAMSLLGNDFLPHSLSVKMREDGHAFLLSELKALKEAGQQFIKEEDSLWKINYEAVHRLFNRWKDVEEDRIAHTCKKKFQMRGNVQITLESKPLEDPVEKAILYRNEKQWSLKKGWQEHYREQWLFCKSEADVNKCCREYLTGLQWVLDYYTGQRAVDMTWFYPRLVPPLWSDLYMYLEKGYEIPEPSPSKEAPILPLEQLAMVLPLQSWHYIPSKSPLRTLPSRYPQFWPQQFGFFSAGRVWTWECEPLLPVLPIQVVRQMA
jgi:5'-3' exoribonuclease 1